MAPHEAGQKPRAVFRLLPRSASAPARPPPRDRSDSVSTATARGIPRKIASSRASAIVRKDLLSLVVHPKRGGKLASSSGAEGESALDGAEDIVLLGASVS